MSPVLSRCLPVKCSSGARLHRCGVVRGGTTAAFIANSNFKSDNRKLRCVILLQSSQPSRPAPTISITRTVHGTNVESVSTQITRGVACASRLHAITLVAQQNNSVIMMFHPMFGRRPCYRNNSGRSLTLEVVMIKFLASVNMAGFRSQFSQYMYSFVVCKFTPT